MSERVHRAIRRIGRTIGGEEGERTARHLKRAYRPRPLSVTMLRGLQRGLQRLREDRVAAEGGTP